ncbi:DUF2779 domain-containing protein [Leptolyngbya sp. FACHB-541]|uniref:DUF2779 domain-containing protein n=1 Tax=Leptolyngbya sp. FACHB-541 TaxID=2692810 RepID=UPI0016828950|nr:DUF2779 domain-containing protein [Leptolyngbya sp. FACHB-541]MBD2001051.1 DUF2779 domain-containing protein [Leptolyngbya sp. FACHB-541]
MAALLKKSNFMSGLQCLKKLWLEVQEPQQATALSPAQQRIIDQGKEVGHYARQQFSNGQLIVGNGNEALQATQEAIATGVACLFEAAFSFDNLFIRCDILQKTSAVTWELIEVKSSSKVKDEHQWDLALQKYVLIEAGLPIGKTKLMHINTQTCCFPNLTDLFVIEDITEEVDRLLSEVSKQLEQFRVTLTENLEPTLAIGKHCTSPNPCPFTQTCWQHVPEVSIFTIPRLDWKKKDTLLAQGVLAIADLPLSYALSDNQRTYVDSVLTNQPVIDKAAIVASLAKLEHPIHFFDFEAQNPAIPRFDGLKPYEQFSFQYSCHVLQSDGSVEHHEYLHTDQSDPRPSLIAALTTDIASIGSIVVYHKSFEASSLRKLAGDFPEHASELVAIANRLWDLEDIFKYHYKHPSFRGSTSIKNVLPILVSNLSYKSQTIQRGDQAQAVWEEMLICLDEAKRTQMINDLKSYCQLDTLAMVEIYKFLLKMLEN